VVIGYLLGFFFSCLLEAAAFAGELVGTLMGFSATELLDPLATSSHPLMSRFFSFLAFALFLALDLFLPMLRFFFDCFVAFSPLNYPFTPSVIQAVIQASSCLFEQALLLAALPLTLLLTLIALFAILSRFLPIFWIGFPLLIFVGLFSIAGSLPFFISTLAKAFAQFWTLLKLIK